MFVAMNDKKLPTIAQLKSGKYGSQSDLQKLLDTDPPIEWLRPHPHATVKNSKGEDVPLPYLPIERVEFLLRSIYHTWTVEIKTVQYFANNVIVVVRLCVTEMDRAGTQFHDGLGAAPIQSGLHSDAFKSYGVQTASPAAESYAIKDAAEKFGRLFGKDLGRMEASYYDTLEKVMPPEKKQEKKPATTSKARGQQITEGLEKKLIPSVPASERERLSFP